MPTERKSNRAVPPYLFIIMKKIILSLVAMVIATLSYAQNMMVATLSHGEDIKMYYGSYAYKQAMNDAVDGDVINLSGGGFQAVNITKAVSLRGAGIDSGDPTYIVNDFNVQIPSKTSGRFSAEGIYFSGTMTVKDTLSNAYFVKSYLKSFECIRNHSNTTVKNALFVNCKVMSVYLYGENSTTQFVNSYVRGFSNYNGQKSTASFINCTINSSGNVLSIYGCTLLNCIVVQDGNYNSLQSSFANNCVSIGYNGTFSSIVAGSNNKYAAKTIFIDSDPLKDLTDEAKKLYIGSDGTQVGMYGGTLPYNTTPSYPQITKMNVAKKTTADGKLSVEIEVSAAQ